MKKGRPKGSLQKNKDISKYWLPDGVILSDNNPDIYNKESKLEFIDGLYRIWDCEKLKLVYTG